MMLIQQCLCPTQSDCRILLIDIFRMSGTFIENVGIIGACEAVTMDTL